jgi:hypothetical protein
MAGSVSERLSPSRSAWLERLVANYSHVTHHYLSYNQASALFIASLAE